MTDRQKIAENARKIIKNKGYCAGIECKDCPCRTPIGNPCNVNDSGEGIFVNDKKLKAVAICEQWLKDNPDV